MYNATDHSHENKTRELSNIYQNKSIQIHIPRQYFSWMNVVVDAYNARIYESNVADHETSARFESWNSTGDLMNEPGIPIWTLAILLEGIDLLRWPAPMFGDEIFCPGGTWDFGKFDGRIEEKVDV
ncbi:uncharacterized protein RAG0_16713 [Rhynchosporium agropyri]|uniref:Uncharacterized protein n=1 Tax=Rhynchosporium agropyri TaxID=914238 RepID=A0A1E1LRK3_9HELO|nr:uncharacterized protein RAG0_16713 [Rhynchosporium agropyri]